MTSWVVEHLGPDVPMHFTAFHPDYRMLDRPPTPPATLTRARRIAMDNGVRYAYTGNVHDADGGSTFCHQCGDAGDPARLVRRWATTGSTTAATARRAVRGIPGRLRRPGRQLGPTPPARHAAPDGSTEHRHDLTREDRTSSGRDHATDRAPTGGRRLVLPGPGRLAPRRRSARAFAIGAPGASRRPRPEGAHRAARRIPVLGCDRGQRVPPARARARRRSDASCCSGRATASTCAVSPCRARSTSRPRSAWSRSTADSVTSSCICRP